MDPLETIAELFEHAGARSYFGEAVSVSTHMLQAAVLAERAGAADALIAAALLHDVGHLLAVQNGSDDRHEETGAQWLAQWLPADVTEPIRLHVAAKRFLCATQPGYRELLSAASLQSLELQGGPMRAEEVRAFAHLPFAEDAVAVRRWDEAAKDPARPTPAFAHFEPLLQRLIASAGLLR
jgi:gamma-butyrobetaine dioxygenase